MIRTPIRDRLILVGAVVIAAIIGATGLIMQMERKAAIDAFRTATVNLDNGMAQQTTQSIASVDRVLSEIQTGLTFAPDATAAEITGVMRLKSTFDLLVELRKRLSGVDALSLIDADGWVTNDSGGWPSPMTDVSGQEFFGHFRTGDDHTVFVGTPVKNEVSGKWTAALVRRVDDARGNFAGLVIAEISLGDLQDFYRVAMPENRAVYVLRRDGIILVRYPPRDEEIGRKIPDQSAWYPTVAQGGGTYRSSAYLDATPILAAVRPLRDLPLVVETSVTESDVLSEWYTQNVWVVSGGIFSVICVVILLRLFAGQYRRVELSELSLARKNVELDSAHGQLDATLANLTQGVCFFNADKNLVVYNRRFREVFDLPEKTIWTGMPLAEIAELRIAAGSFTTQTVSEYLATIDDVIRDGRPRDSIVELINGRTISSHIQPLPDCGWVGTQEDITERREAEARIAFLARHDVLTGLPNRALFQERLSQALALAERGKGFALLCLDLDRFKAVNDSFGHPVGDSLLCAVAERLRGLMRESDTIARLGGDEFAILQLGVSDAMDTRILADRIVQAIHEPFELDGRQVKVGTSVGIAVAPGDSSHPVQLMKSADLALYRAKQEGRGAWRFFEPAMDAIARARRELECDLRNAMPLAQMELRYQPFVLVRDRSVSGFEALLRWRHPTRGILAPAEFILIAEEIGLIGEIGAWVLRQACAEAATWPEHLRVAVNLSTRQFRGQTLVSTVVDAMRSSGITPGRLELEITESVPLREDAATLSALHDLRALGARIALDDFGTGYSSLSYLQGFPFDTIKIDRSFVSDLRTRDKSVILGILGLAANLSMSVTAEGVETEDQFDFLAGAGCTEIQGFLISEPAPSHEISALIKRLSSPAVSAVLQDI